MKKVAFLSSVFGGALAAFGFSGWQALGTIPPRSILPGAPDFVSGNIYSAGWTLNNQLEITFGVALLICGLMLHKDSK